MYENTPTPRPSLSSPEYRNVFDSSVSGFDLNAFAAIAVNAEYAADDAALNAVDSYDLPQAPLDELQEMMGLGRGEQKTPARYTGGLYQQMYSEKIEDAGEFVVDAKIVLNKLSYCETDSGYRIMAEIETNDSTSQLYFAPIESMLRLELECDSVQSVLSKYWRLASDLLTIKFLTLDRDQQVGLMQDVATACGAALQKLVDGNVISVTCRQYFEHEPIDAVGEKAGLAVVACEQRGGKRTGQLVGVMYMDVMQSSGHQRPFRSSEDLPYGGVPYIAVQDVTDKSISYVAVDVIDTIT
ncbi:MAG: hypothetical protein ABIR91_04105 [Candidatus Saccharimonadales bacterium]